MLKKNSDTFDQTPATLNNSCQVKRLRKGVTCIPNALQDQKEITLSKTKHETMPEKNFRNDIPHGLCRVMLWML